MLHAMRVHHIYVLHACTSNVEADGFIRLQATIEQPKTKPLPKNASFRYISSCRTPQRLRFASIDCLNELSSRLLLLLGPFLVLAVVHVVVVHVALARVAA